MVTALESVLHAIRATGTPFTPGHVRAEIEGTPEPRGHRRVTSGAGSATRQCSSKVQQPGRHRSIPDQPIRPDDLCKRPSLTSMPIVRIEVVRPRWPLFGRQRTLNAAIYCAPVSSISAGQQRNGQVADARVTVYGSSEGWGSSPSERARSEPLPFDDLAVFRLKGTYACLLIYSPVWAWLPLACAEALRACARVSTSTGSARSRRRFRSTMAAQTSRGTSATRTITRTIIAITPSCVTLMRRGPGHQHMHGMRRPGAGLVETMWRSRLVPARVCRLRTAARYSNLCAPRLSGAGIDIHTGLHHSIATRTVPVVCIQKASLRGPDADRVPGLLLILAAEHTADLRTPEP